MNTHPERLRIRAYVVLPEWECDCPQCGEPVLRNDTAFQIEDADDAIEAGFCSRGCARVYAVALEERIFSESARAGR